MSDAEVCCAHADATAEAPANATNATKEDEHVTIAQYIDKQLENEFKDEEAATHEHHDLNETLSKEKVCCSNLVHSLCTSTCTSHG